MVKKKIYSILSGLTAAFHFSIVLLYVACIFIIFTSKELRIYAAISFLLIWILQKIFKGCALTKVEGYFLRKSGKKCDNPFFFNRFAHNFFKKTFNISVSRVAILFQAMLLFFVIVSIVVIILYFAKSNFFYQS